MDEPAKVVVEIELYDALTQLACVWCARLYIGRVRFA